MHNSKNGDDGATRANKCDQILRYVMKNNFDGKHIIVKFEDEK